MEANAALKDLKNWFVFIFFPILLWFMIAVGNWLLLIYLRINIKTMVITKAKRPKLDEVAIEQDTKQRQTEPGYLEDME